MNERLLFAAIGDIDEQCLQRCEEYRPAQSWQKFIRCAAVFAGILVGVLLISYFTIPQARASIDASFFHADTRDYIILPPEVTKWEEPVPDSNGGVTSSCTLSHSGKGYALTRDEYLRLMNGEDPAAILADRDIWAAEWKDYDGPQWASIDENKTIERE